MYYEKETKRSRQADQGEFDLQRRLHADFTPTLDADLWEHSDEHRCLRAFCIILATEGLVNVQENTLEESCNLIDRELLALKPKKRIFRDMWMVLSDHMEDIS